MKMSIKKGTNAHVFSQGIFASVVVVRDSDTSATIQAAETVDNLLPAAERREATTSIFIDWRGDELVVRPHNGTAPVVMRPLCTACRNQWCIDTPETCVLVSVATK